MGRVDSSPGKAGWGKVRVGERMSREEGRARGQGGGRICTILGIFNAFLRGGQYSQIAREWE